MVRRPPHASLYDRKTSVLQPRCRGCDMSMVPIAFREAGVVRDIKWLCLACEADEVRDAR